MYFGYQPLVEVTDLGGNRVAAGVHVISLDLAAGDGRLRGPKTRYSRHGVATFDRLRIKAPGYDKRIRASSPGLVDGLSEPFGVVPHGIPYALQFVTMPAPAVLSASILDDPIVTIEVLDVYGKRVAMAPETALSPYTSSTSPEVTSRMPLAAICESVPHQPRPPTSRQPSLVNKDPASYLPPAHPRQQGPGLLPPASPALSPPTLSLPPSSLGLPPPSLLNHTHPSHALRNLSSLPALHTTLIRVTTPTPDLT